MTDGDVLDLLELDAELREEIREARLRRGRRVPRWITRVPHEIVVPVSHEVATERQLDLEPVVGVGVRESQADIGRRAVGAAIETRERDGRRGLSRRWRVGDCGGARADGEQRQEVFHRGSR